MPPPPPKSKPSNPFGRYVLDGQTPVPEPDFWKWARWMELANARRVARTELPGGGYVSTIFLGLDHSFGGPRPVLFETLSRIGGEWEDYFDRYSTWAEAEAGHAAIVAQALAAFEHAAAGLAAALVPVRQGEE